MATRKITFTVPEEIAGQLMRRVPSRDRSRYITEAITAKLREREQRLIRACESANADLDVLAIERDWDAVPSDVDEPWSDAPAR